MINRLEIKCFHSFEELELEMRPLTVLIGPNGGGKSNLLDVFSFLSQAALGELAEGIARRGGFDSLHFRGTASDRISLGVDFSPDPPFAEEGADIHYKLELRSVGSVAKVWFEQVSIGPKPGHARPIRLMHRDKDGCRFRNLPRQEMEEVKQLESETELAVTQVKDQQVYPTPYKLVRTVGSWGFYPPTSTGLDAAIRRPQLLRPGLRLATNGGNLASALHALQNRYPHVYDDLVDRLRNACAGFKYLSFPPEGGDGMINLRWWEEPYDEEFGFSANLLSDGTLRLLMLLAILLSPDPPPLICIDEPELGLHPDWIKLIAELAVTASERTQLVIATHSPEFVSKVRPSDVVIVEKTGGQTVAERLKDDELEDWLTRFRLGELWMAGQLGGRP